MTHQIIFLGVAEGVSHGTAKGLFKILESNKPFPTNEIELKSICTELGIQKRTAYLNFKPEQFDINMKLMNLKLVDNDITDDFINRLHDEIIMEYSMQDLNIASSKLIELEMYSINVNEIDRRIKKLHDYLEIGNKDKVLNSSDETITKLF